MFETYSNPWNFSNSDLKLFALDQTRRIEYGELNEVGMGAPLGGQCYLIEDGQRVLVSKWCAGPPAWETQGWSVALPVWTRKLFKGTVQQIAVVDIVSKVVTYYKETFEVLDLRSFDKNVIYGYDSPIHNTRTVAFDITKAKVERVEPI
jgi:hypothetical protein